MTDTQKTEVETRVDAHMDRFLDGLEERLATAMQKALDTVTTEYDERLKELEADMARVLRHLGLNTPERISDRDRETL